MIKYLLNKKNHVKKLLRNLKKKTFQRYVYIFTLNFQLTRKLADNSFETFRAIILN